MNAFGVIMSQINRFKVTDISCKGCTDRIEKALIEVEGIIKVIGDPETKEVEITFDKVTLTLEKIISEFDLIGFDATLL